MNASGDAHRITTLATGLRVVTERVPGVRSVSLAAWVATGARHEDDDSRGYAHFLEHLLFKGNERIDAADISRFFDRIGSDANAATSREHTVFHARVLDTHVADALGVFGEMIWAPALADDDVDAEREVILEEIAMYEDSPSDIVHEIADDLVFPDHPLGRPIVGTIESISNATPAELRAFHAASYLPDTIVVSAAGNIDHDAFVALVEQRFCAQHPQARARPSVATQDRPGSQPPGSYERLAELRHKDSEQVHLVLAGRGVHRRDDRRFAAALLDTILGNAPSSRLFLEVRERRGLAYSIYTFFAGNSDSGQTGIYVGVRPDRVDEVLGVLRAELERITTEPPSPEEIELAAGHLEGRMLLSLESTTVRGNRLGASLVLGTPIETLEQTVARIRAVTADDLLALARETYDPASLSLAVVADDVEAVRAAAARHDLLGAAHTEVRT